MPKFEGEMAGIRQSVRREEDKKIKTVGFMASGDARSGLRRTVDPCALLFDRDVILMSYEPTFPSKAESVIVRVPG